jgi:hypothetical protein
VKDRNPPDPAIRSGSVNQRPAEENPDHPPWTLCSPRDSRHHRGRPLPLLAAHPHPAVDSREAQAAPGAAVLTTPEGLCAAAVHSRKAPPRVKSEPGPPMTLGGAAAAGVRLIVWCRGASIMSSPDPAEMAGRYGAETTVPDWAARLVCGRCGSRRVNMVVSGTH